MKTKDKQKTGRFSVEIEVVNYQDMVKAESGVLDPAAVRRKTISALVDSGATRLVLPQALAKDLGLRVKDTKTKVRNADGRRSLRNEVEAVYLLLQGRTGLFTAVVEPKRDTALLGAIVLEDLDFVVDCTNQRLVPRDPDHVLTEIE
jgi:predicted aspartyl protease